MKTETRVRPRQGQVYTLREIEESLTLRDSPFLEIVHAGKYWPIQTSHVDPQDVLAIPGFGDSEWRYILETEEWIPIFRYVGAQPITDFVDIEDEVDPWSREPTGSWWVTLKAFPRVQYSAG